MLYYDKIDLSEKIDAAKSNSSEECIISHHWSFNHGSKFQNSVSNGCYDLLCLSISDIVIITAKGVYYCCIIHGIDKSNAIHACQ